MQLIKNMVILHLFVPLFFTTTTGEVYNLQNLGMNPKTDTF